MITNTLNKTTLETPSNLLQIGSICKCVALFILKWFQFEVGLKKKQKTKMKEKEWKNSVHDSILFHIQYDFFRQYQKNTV